MPVIVATRSFIKLQNDEEDAEIHIKELSREGTKNFRDRPNF